jgi:hypothetical protein
MLVGGGVNLVLLNPVPALPLVLGFAPAPPVPIAGCGPRPTKPAPRSRGVLVSLALHPTDNSPKDRATHAKARRIR